MVTIYNVGKIVRQEKKHCNDYDIVHAVTMETSSELGEKKLIHVSVRSFVDDTKQYLYAIKADERGHL